MYYVIRKNVEGVYLINDRNEILEKTSDKLHAASVFSKYILNKQKSERYVMFEKPDNDRRLQIILER